MTFYLDRISQCLSPSSCRLIDGHVYEISSSEMMLKSYVKEALSSLELCFIFAENRVSNNIRFTAVPYRKKEDFDKKQCPDLHMTNEELNQSIKRIVTSQQGKFCRCEQNLGRMAHSFPEVSSFLLSRLSRNVPLPGKVKMSLFPLAFWFMVYIGLAFNYPKEAEKSPLGGSRPTS